ncbi:MAG: DNA polymerase III subunit alpha [Bacteroidales bacterium]|nr:DNA polymerase III subunit alpha [Bacteroidales bacterium]
MLLAVHSYNSLCYGTMPIQDLVGRAAALGYRTLPLTDINTTMGAVDFVAECQKKGVRPVMGVEFRNGKELLYVALAKNNQGFAELNRCLTQHNINKQSYPETAPEWENVFVVYPFGKRKPTQLKEHEFLGVRLSQLTQMFRQDSLEKLVAMQPVTFAKADDFQLHQCMCAIDENVLISRLAPSTCAAPDEILLSADRLKTTFALYPQLMDNAQRLLDQCEINLDGSVKSKRTFTDNVFDDRELLRQLAFDGMAYRYGTANKTAYRRIEKELDIIERMGFCAYFLIAWEIVQFAMKQGFYHVGRGSGANSVVAYCLRITDVDPIELDLYFERFLNPKRSSPPDFDLDFSWRERDQVIAHLFKRYGQEHVALLGATVTFQDNSLCRELGKVFGLPKGEIDQMERNPEAFARQNELGRQILAFAERLRDFPRQRSIHAGGVLITENPMTDYAALDLPPKGFPTTQYDMYSAEKLGLDKIDILSQRGIAHIRDAVEMVERSRGIRIDIHQINALKQDELIYRQLLKAETCGCFYIESPAMRGLLRKLRCSDYKTLVAASSIIRPGVAKSGMMRAYIDRFHHPESVDYKHPLLKELLGETYGVMIYQEDVLKVGHYFAGLDLAEADVLRRMMGHKMRDKSEFEAVERKFFGNCKAKGYPDALVGELWRQIESFSGYSFSKAHSASYAVESYQSLYLKSHYPLEFQVAVINNFGGYYQTWFYYNEARRMGARIHLPCVNRSHYLTSLDGRTIYMGFVHLLGLEQQFVEQVVAEREARGPYSSLEDFIARVPFSLEQLVLLIRGGAFGFTKKTKAELLWQAHLHKSQGRKEQPETLFRLENQQFEFPEFKTDDLRDAYDEIELYGFPVSLTWFDLLATSFRGELMAAQMLQFVGRRYRMLGKLVTVKYVRTCKGETMALGTFVDATGEAFDTVHFPQALKAWPFQGDGVYLLLGKVTEDFGQPSLEVEKMAKMPYKPRK